MEEFEPVPPDAGEARKRWQAGTDTFGRVYDVLLGVTTLTPYAEIATVAGCSPNAAKKHLDRLTDMGVARGDTESEPARYARNEAYLEWQEASRIAQECSVAEIIERVRALETQRSSYEEQFGATDPATVSAFGSDDHDAVHERMEAVSDWQGIVRDIRLYELAHRLAQNDGHLLPV